MPPTPPTITITTNHSASSYGQPVCLLDGELVEGHEGLREALYQLRWTQKEAAEKCGKSLPMIVKYLAGNSLIPAEVWNVISDALVAGELNMQPKTETGIPAAGANGR